MDETNNSKENLLVTRSYLVDALAILFGIGSWIGVTSVFLQLPLIVETAPEGWSLPSYLVITVQAANIFSFVYVVYQKYSPRKINDGHFIYVTMVIGCVAGICMSFLYHQTTDIGGSPHSVSLLVFTLMFAVTGCMSSMLFMPYMGRFREIYLVTYLLGQGLNGFVSSILTLIQGVGGTPECLWDNSTGTYTKYIPPPRFGPNIFFLFVFAILVLSTIAFILLNTLRVCKNQYAAGTVGLGNVYHYDKSEKDNELRGAVPEDVRNLSKFNFVFLISVEAFSNLFGNSILPAIQAFSFLPYGSVTYHLSVTLATIASPLACFVAMFIPHISIRSIRVLSVFSIATSVYIVCIALSSPTPPLKDSLVGPILIMKTSHVGTTWEFGSVLIPTLSKFHVRSIYGTVTLVASLYRMGIFHKVSSWALFNAVISYMKLSITAIFRYQEGKSLVLVGTINQISSASGALLAFYLVNYTNAFTAYEPC